LKEKTKASKDECTHISIPNNIVEVGRKQKGNNDENIYRLQNNNLTSYKYLSSVDDEHA
jgi:hypothetical protein